MRWFSWIVGLLVAGWMLSTPSVAHAGKLGAVRSEVRNGSGGGGRSSSGSSYSGGSSSDDGDSGSAAGDIALGILGAIFEGIGSSSKRNRRRAYNGPPTPPPPPTTYGRFHRYPYHGGHEGHVLRTEDKADPRGRLHSGRLSVEGAYMGDDVWRSSFDLDVSLWRVSLLSDMGFYLEQPLEDALYLGGTYVGFTAVMQPRVVWRLGLGANYMVDGRTPGEGHREYAAGVGGTTRLDVFPIKPLVISARGDFGTLYKARTWTGRVTAGVLIRGFEVYGGYEVRTVGRVPMYGPVIGLRAWF